MMWEKIGASAALMLILGCMAYLIRRLEKGKDQILPILSFLAALFLFILPAFKPTSLPPDYVALHQPWLEPVLIISQLKEGAFRASYEIKNLGQLPAEELRLFFSSPVMKGVDKSILTPRHIAPQGSIFFEPNPLPFPTKQLEPYSHFTLAIDYHAQVGDIKRAFRSVFDVGLRKDELKEGPYNPSSVMRVEGEFSDQELIKFLGFRTQFTR